MGSRLRRHDRGQLQSDTLELVSEPSDTNPGLLNTPSLAEEAAEPLGRADFDDENYDDEYGLEMDYIPDDTEFAPFERENAFDYRPGGFHPVILGDFLDPDQRFKVVSKLGHGGFATVWLCRDTKENSWRAVKIMKADNSNEEACSELRIAKLFADVDGATLAGNHIVLPLEHLSIDGPNGRHLCLVLPLLACPIKDAWFKHGGNAAWRKEVGYQLAQAVAFLHSRGVCHGDLRPANILLKPRGLDLLSEEELTALIGNAGVEEFPDHEGILRGDHTPTQLYADSYLDLDAEHMSSEIAIIDFGVAFRAEEAPEQASIPRQYAAPEVLLSGGGQPSLGIDLWSLGCTLFELSVDRAPFEYEFRGIQGLVEDMEEALGPLPEPYRSGWTDSGNRIRGEGHPLSEGADLPMVSLTPEDLRERRELRMKNMGSDDMLLARLTQETTFYLENGRLGKDGETGEFEAETRDGAPVGYDRVVNRIAMDEARLLKDLLLQLWRYQPEGRATAESLLGHSWFDGREGQSGTATGYGWALSHIFPYISLSAIADWICISRKP